MGGVTPHCRIGGVAILLPLDARVFTQLKCLGMDEGIKPLKTKSLRDEGETPRSKRNEKWKKTKTKKVQRETQVNVWRGTESFELEALARPWKEGINE